MTGYFTAIDYHAPRVRFNPMDPDQFALHCSHLACDFVSAVHTCEATAREEFDAHHKGNR